MPILVQKISWVKVKNVSTLGISALAEDTFSTGVDIRNLSDISYMTLILPQTKFEAIPSNDTEAVAFFAEADIPPKLWPNQQKTCGDTQILTVPPLYRCHSEFRVTT